MAALGLIRSRGRWRRAAQLAICLLASVAVSAWAIWSAGSSATSAAAAAAASVNQGATPTASAASGRAVTVNWGASTLSNGHAVDGYIVKRYDAGTGLVQTTWRVVRARSPPRAALRAASRRDSGSTR